MAEFSVGDVVKLRSGGPFMTVSALTHRCEEGTIRCDWFDSDRDGNYTTPQSSYFAPECLLLERAVKKEESDAA